VPPYNFASKGLSSIPSIIQSDILPEVQNSIIFDYFFVNVEFLFNSGDVDNFIKYVQKFRI